MRKLITKKEFAETKKYSKQMGGHEFTKLLGPWEIIISCHHRHGDRLQIQPRWGIIFDDGVIFDDEDNNCESEYFNFDINRTSYEEVENWIKELQDMIRKKLKTLPGHGNMSWGGDNE